MMPRRIELASSQGRSPMIKPPVIVYDLCDTCADGSVGGQVEVDIHDCPVVGKSKRWSMMGVEIVHHSKTQNQPPSGGQAMISPENLS